MSRKKKKRDYYSSCKHKLSENYLSRIDVEE